MQLIFGENDGKVEEAVEAEAAGSRPSLERKLFRERFRSETDPVSFKGAATFAADCNVLGMAANK